MLDIELSYKEFSNRFDFEWYAQPDGGTKSVIFSYVPKGMYSLDKKEWRQPIRFEAESLEKAFNYASQNEKVVDFGWKPYGGYADIFGKITPFKIDAWNKVENPTTFWSIGSKCWKVLAEVLEQEKKQKYATV